MWGRLIFWPPSRLVLVVIVEKSNTILMLLKFCFSSLKAFGNSFLFIMLWNFTIICSVVYLLSPLSCAPFQSGNPGLSTLGNFLEAFFVSFEFCFKVSFPSFSVLSLSTLDPLDGSSNFLPVYCLPLCLFILLFGQSLPLYLVCYCTFSFVLYDDF